MDPYQTLLPIQQQQQRQLPSMAPQAQPQQQPAGYNNGTVPGGVASMVKALGDVMKQRQMTAQAQAAQGTQPVASGLPGVSVPMTPNAIPNAPGSQASLPGMPNGVDPSIQGLFSPIPGAGGYSGG